MLKNIEILLPDPFRGFQFYKKFGVAGEATVKDWENQFKVTSQTWREHKPKWSKKVSVKANEIIFNIWTHDDVYRFLNDGTKLRYAVMTDDFSAKTSPGRFKPGRGRGGKDRMDFTYVLARMRAIKPRGWDIQVKNRTKRHVARRFESAMRNGVQDSGHKYGRN